MRIGIPAFLALAAWLTGSPSRVRAQTPDAARAFEVAVGPSRFIANTANWGIHAGASWRLPREFRQLSLAAVGFYGPARADSTSPGVSSVGLEVGLATRDPWRTPVFNFVLTFGVARTRFNARRQEAALADCLPALGCMAEGVVSYHTGTYLTWVPGAALELPLSSALAVRAHGRVLFTRDDPIWGTQSIARLDVGLSWRP